LPAFLIPLSSSILQVLCFGVEVSASRRVHQEEPELGNVPVCPWEKQQLSITPSIFGWYLGLTAPPVLSKAIKGKEVNAYKCISLGC